MISIQGVPSAYRLTTVDVDFRPFSLYIYISFSVAPVVLVACLYCKRLLAGTMRYLLNLSTSSKRLTKTTAAAAVAAWTPTHATATTKTITATQQLLQNASNNNGSSSSATKKWGQQCGLTCGCVVRFDLELDQNDRVIMAEYTAKKILTTTIPIPIIPKFSNLKDMHHKKNNSRSAGTTGDSKQHQEQPSPPPPQVRPVFTNRTKRLQYVSCNCSTLHALCSKSIQYFINRPIYQLVNAHEFQSARSSHAFRDTILSSLCHTDDTSSTIPIHPTTNTPKKQIIKNHRNTLFQPQPQQSPPLRRHDTGTNIKNHHHCFDLVEDAITALLKGYIPSPRQPPTNEICTLPISSEDAIVADKSYDRHYNLNDDYDDQQLRHWAVNTAKSNTNATSTSPWQERMLHPWWPFTSWTHNNSSNYDDDNDGNENKNSTNTGVPQIHKSYASDDVKQLQQRLSTLSNTGSDRRHWTALDWMDWFEYDRELKQQQQAPSFTKQNETRVIDWLTYVDTLYNGSSTYISPASDQQSA